ncbi:phosphoserine phosphatase SerB [Litorilituus sediminis]|uniref:phosphoserine phosphatase SerB n=1 Tax=Litorilituus sediminis TaxID=718192 RepID=UPI001FE38033|nr:phosphoserine phosphatase SerB [Litorilituus sediminis]
MSDSANDIPLTTAFSELIEQASLPLYLSYENKTISLADKTQTLPQAELVVFSDLNLTSLHHLLNSANLTPVALTAVNSRNKLTSYRFNVDCTDFISARKAVAQFALKQGFEAALVMDVPKLNQPGLLVMDMDSTTIEIECIDEIAKLAGVGEQVSEVTERAMQGELDFAQSLHQRVATLAGAPEQILADVAKDIPLMAGLSKLIAELKEHNWRIAIASGGFTYFADHLKDTLKLDAAFANTLEIVDGKLTGKVLGDVVDAQVKADSLAILAKEYHIEDGQTVAMGDGANDLVMMAAASFGVAFHAKAIVLEQADSCINFKGLDCLLHWLA